MIRVSFGILFTEKRKDHAAETGVIARNVRWSWMPARSASQPCLVRRDGNELGRAKPWMPLYPSPNLHRSLGAFMPEDIRFTEVMIDDLSDEDVVRVFTRSVEASTLRSLLKSAVRSPVAFSALRSAVRSVLRSPGRSPI